MVTVWFSSGEEANVQVERVVQTDKQGVSHPCRGGGGNGCWLGPCQTFTQKSFPLSQKHPSCSGTRSIGAVVVSSWKLNRPNWTKSSLLFWTSTPTVAGSGPQQPPSPDTVAHSMSRSRAEHCCLRQPDGHRRKHHLIADCAVIVVVVVADIHPVHVHRVRRDAVVDVPVRR